MRRGSEGAQEGGRCPPAAGARIRRRRLRVGAAPAGEPPYPPSQLPQQRAAPHLPRTPHTRPRPRRPSAACRDRPPRVGTAGGDGPSRATTVRRRRRNRRAAGRGRGGGCVRGGASAPIRRAPLPRRRAPAPGGRCRGRRRPAPSPPACSVPTAARRRLPRSPSRGRNGGRRKPEPGGSAASGLRRRGFRGHAGGACARQATLRAAKCSSMQRRSAATSGCGVWSSSSLSGPCRFVLKAERMGCSSGKFAPPTVSW
jgi:hypothetical protein